MRIRSELRLLYPPHWLALSRHIRFERAGERCQRCGRPNSPVSAASRTGADSTNKLAQPLFLCRRTFAVTE